MRLTLCNFFNLIINLNSLFVNSSNEISIPELEPIVSQFTDCLIHFVSTYVINELPTILSPYSISDTSEHNINNSIPSRYLKSEQICRLVIIIFYNGKQKYEEHFDKIFLDSFKSSNGNSHSLLLSPTCVLLFHINFTVNMNNEILLGFKTYLSSERYVVAL